MDNLEKQKINELLLESYLESERQQQYEESTLLRLGAGAVNKRSKQWSKFAKKIVKKTPFCTVCLDADFLQVHHIKPFRLFPELELVEKNCMVLCRIHHYAIGHGGISWMGYNSNVIEDSDWFSQSLKNHYIR